MFVLALSWFFTSDLCCTLSFLRLFVNIFFSSKLLIFVYNWGISILSGTFPATYSEKMQISHRKAHLPSFAPGVHRNVIDLRYVNSEQNLLNDD